MPYNVCGLSNDDPEITNSEKALLPFMMKCRQLKIESVLAKKRLV